MIDYTNLVNLLGNFGFPAVITIYLFSRFETKIENLESVIIELKDAINRLKRGDERNG